MPHIAGGKVTSCHTTVTDKAKKVVKLIEPIPLVDKISLKEIKQVNCSDVVHIVKRRHFILLVVKQGSTLQEINVYSFDHQKCMEQIFQALRPQSKKKNRYEVKFT